MVDSCFTLGLGLGLGLDTGVVEPELNRTGSLGGVFTADRKGPHNARE